jgi:4-aminobutyrate aminotransferase-like enzyme
MQSRQILDLNAFRPGDRLADPELHALVERRLRNQGPVSVLFFDEPLHAVRAEGVWLHAADGRRYLDVYNNVPSVGHCHPLVVEAVARQMGLLNIHTRYLNERTEAYAERLKGLLPASLDKLAFTCSGSEANDLALRLARHATGKRGIIVTSAAYHGNTAAVIEVSPAAWKRGRPPGFLRLVPPPGPEHYSADVAGGFAGAVAEAAAGLEAAGHGVAALIADSIFSSDGVYADPPGLLATAAAAIRAAGALWIADEVQPGFARTGDAFWGFARHGLVPDIVTMGKPMGNGFPLAGLATRGDILAPYFADFGYFNTFGGNPVAAAAGMAVLEAIASEGLQDNARTVGAYLRRRLESLATERPAIRAVRGAGLFIGVTLGDAVGRPDAGAAGRAINALRQRGILIGAAGQDGSVLKIRPPLCFGTDHADLLVDTLADVLAT